METATTASDTEQGTYQVSGPGILISATDFVMLCETASGQSSRDGELFQTCIDALSQGQDGHELSHRVTDLIHQAPPGDFPSLCAFGSVPGGVVVIVHGRAELILDAGDRELRYDGSTGATVVDGELARQVSSVRAVINDDEVELNAPWPAPLDAIDPVPGPDPAADPGPAADGDLVVGVSCRTGHFNDPEMAYCTVCGIAMAQATRLRVLGRRPALGVLVLDDGTLLPLVREHVFGRDPDSDDAVRSGRAVPVRLSDTMVSRVHARIAFDGWDVRVVDAGSTNGTFVCEPGGPGTWIRLGRGAEVPLQPGMVLAFGNHRVRYHSHRAQSVDFSNLEPLPAAS